MSTDASFWETIDAIRDEDDRHRREAYAFVVAALGWTVEQLPRERRDDPERRHLSGRELLRGVVTLAHREFGDLAPVVFREWGVTANEDIGRIVFQLIARGQLSARPEDTMDDFRGGPELLEALADAPPEVRRRGGPTREPGA